METDFKAYDLFWQLYQNNKEFQTLIKENMKLGKIRFFNENEWSKIKRQNFIPFAPDMPEFIDLFIKGYNIGSCATTARQLSYSYNDVSIVSGVLPILKGSKNAELVGGHVWLETDKTIIDTSLMLVIDLSLKDLLGYQEEQKITPQMLRKSDRYQARKELVNDQSFKKA